MQKGKAGKIAYLQRTRAAQQAFRHDRRYSLLKQQMRARRRRAIQNCRIEIFQLLIMGQGGGQRDVQIGMLLLQLHQFRQQPAHSAGRSAQAQRAAGIERLLGGVLHQLVALL